MESFGLGDSWALLFDGGREVVGRSRADLLERARGSALLINVMGFVDDEELLGAVPLRVFLDIDPGFGHMWQELGLAEPFQGHDRYVTVGGRIGRDGLRDPDLRHRLDPGAAVRGALGVARGRRPAKAPSRASRAGAARSGRSSTAGAPTACACTSSGASSSFRNGRAPASRSRSTSTTPTSRTSDALREHGWAITDPREVAGDPWRYRDYVQGSGAELMIAKNLYVDTRSGWFSDRSACYLASGKPVLAQDTGLEGCCRRATGCLRSRPSTRRSPAPRRSSRTTTATATRRAQSRASIWRPSGSCRRLLDAVEAR